MARYGSVRTYLDRRQDACQAAIQELSFFQAVTRTPQLARLGTGSFYLAEKNQGAAYVTPLAGY
jgi:hypothetical protein